MLAKELHEKMVVEAREYKFPEGLYKLLEEGNAKKITEYYFEIFKTHWQKNNYSYEYLACMVRHLNPKYVVEIGGDRGVGSLALSAEVNGKIYSVDIRDGWEYVPKNNKKIVKLLGNSIEVEFPIDLSKVGLWYIDGDHGAEHVFKEVKRFQQYWKDTVIMFDDVFYYKEVWDQFKCDKYYTRNDFRGNGWGICVI